MTEAPTRISSRRAVRFGYLVLGVLVLALLKKITDFDIWFDLVLGREIFETLRLPRTEFYLYSLLDQPTTWPEWGFGLLHYAVYHWFGFWGMSLLKALTAGATLFVFYRAAEVDRPRGPVAVLLLCGLLWLVDHRAVYRPEMVLYLCLGCQIYLLERYLVDGRWRWLAPLPALGCALANFHPSVFFLLVVIVFYAAQRAREAGSANKWAMVPRALAPLVVALCATGLAALLNPYGLQQITLPFTYAQSTDLLDTIAEYRPTLTTNYRWPFVGIGVLGIWAAIVRRPRRAVDVLLLVLFGYLGFRYVRNVALFGLAMYVPVTRAVEDLVRRLPVATGTIGKRALWSTAGAGLCLTLLAFVLRPQWGAGVDTNRVPNHAVEILEAVQPEGRIFNYYETGGYLAWKLYDRYRVFIDGRRYTNDLANATHNAVFFEGDRRWEQILADYDVDAIVTRATTTVTGQLVALVAFLDADEDWALVSVEPWYYLFLRKDAIGQSHAATVLSKDEMWRMVIGETDAIMKAYPRSSTPALLTRGIAYFKLRRFDEAARWIGAYSRRRPSDRDTARLAADLEAAVQGDRAARARIESLYGKAGRTGRRLPRSSVRSGLSPRINPFGRCANPLSS